MAVALAPFPLYAAFDSNGNPLAGGLVDTYAATTTTPLATFADPAGATPNTNPVVLDASGRAAIYFTVGLAYKIRQRDAAGVVLWTVDNFVVNPQGDPTLINDYSTNVSQSEETLDPGEVGTEVLATSLANELKQLRFVEKEMKGTASWRTTNATRHMILSSNNADTDNVVWTPTGTNAWKFRTFIPDGWSLNSNITLKLYRRSGSAAGTSKMIWEAVRIRDATAPLILDSGFIDFTPGDLNDHLVTITVNVTTNVQATDGLVINVTRNGDDAGDTNTGTVFPSVLWLEYTGVASR